MRNDDSTKRKRKREHLNAFSKSILTVTAIATLINAILQLCSLSVFSLSENQLLYLFSAIAQVIGGLFGLTLTAYVFFVDKFRDSARDDETYYDATFSLLDQYYHILILTACICGVSIILAVAGIIVLHNVAAAYSFMINETVFLFVISLVDILRFGTMLLDPHKLDKELENLQRKASEKYQEEFSDKPEDFVQFLKTYNQLYDLVIRFAEKCSEKQEYSYVNKRSPQIIQSLQTLWQHEIINRELCDEINDLRVIRNALVHGDEFAVPRGLCDRIGEIYSTLNEAFAVFLKHGERTEEWNKARMQVFALTAER